MSLLFIVVIACLFVVALTFFRSRKHPCVSLAIAALEIAAIGVALVFGSSAAAGMQLQIAGFSFSFPSEPADPEVVSSGTFVVFFSLVASVVFMVIWLLDPKRPASKAP